jgi:hypothetical protein
MFVGAVNVSAFVMRLMVALGAELVRVRKVEVVIYIFGYSGENNVSFSHIGLGSNFEPPNYESLYRNF